MTEEKNIEIEEGQPCPMCFTKNLTLRQVERDLPYVGLTYVFSMECQNCDYAMSDVEFENKQKPSKLSFEIGSEEDLKVRIVKSTQAALKIPRIIEEKPGPGGQGYISNIEGVLEKVKKILEGQRDGAQEKSDRKKAKNMIKKIQDALWGRGKLTIQLYDPTGNSAIISDKTVKK